MNEKSDGRVLVTGATGALGPRVVAALHAAGYRIRTFSIDAPQPGMLPDDVEVQIGDISDPQMVQAAMAGCEAVIHMAALLHIVNPSPELRPKYERVNVDGTATVVEEAMAAGVRRVVFFSTIAVYGDSGGQILTEETPPQPDTFYAQTKLEAEKIVLQARGRDGRPLGVVLRMGAVYGSRIKGNYRRLLQALAQGRFIPIGAGRNRRTLIYDRDVASAALLALEHPRAAGRIYNVTDGHFHTIAAIVGTICEALGRKPPRLSIPETPARIAATVVDDISHRLLHRSPNFRAIIEKYTEDIAVDGRRIQNELGFAPHYDLISGWRETVQEMRQAGEL